MSSLLLLDNGSTQAAAILSLRRIAAALAARIGAPVHPVSLLHADRVPAAALDGRPAETLAPLLRRQLAAGARRFHIIPLFFGPSRALTQAVPELAATLAAELGPFRLTLAPPLCPLPAGEPRLAAILADQVRQAADAAGLPLRRVVLVDHGSPLPEVTAVRQWLARQLAGLLGSGSTVSEAVMERRPGAEYDFNGELLADRLTGLARADPHSPVMLAMLFLSPGRHAGPDGDIARIRAQAESECPGFRVVAAPLVGAHPGLVEMLAERVACHAVTSSA